MHRAPSGGVDRFPGFYMEVLVRNLDELEDLMLVFLERLRWLTPKIGVRYLTLLACLLYANTTTQAVSTTTDVDVLAQGVVATEQLLTRTP